MKKFATLVLAIALMAISGRSAAVETSMEVVAEESTMEFSSPEYPMEVAAHLDLGGASAYGSAFDGFESDEKGPRFAGGVGGNFYYFLTPMFALDGGLQFTGRGHRRDFDQQDGKLRVVWLEFPLGMVADINNFYLGAALSFNFAISNEFQTEFGGAEISTEDQWAGFRRFNIAPKLTAAYTIPVGPVELMPGVAWSMHLLNEIDDDTDRSMRSMNFMVTVGAKYGLPFSGLAI